MVNRVNPFPWLSWILGKIRNNTRASVTTSSPFAEDEINAVGVPEAGIMTAPPVELVFLRVYNMTKKR